MNVVLNLHIGFDFFAIAELFWLHMRGKVVIDAGKVADRRQHSSHPVLQ